MHIYQKNLPPVISQETVAELSRGVNTHVNLTMVNADLPAARKATGSASFSHKTQMCDECEMTSADLQTEKAYTIKGEICLLYAYASMIFAT
jgi:hypothetical protein